MKALTSYAALIALWPSTADLARDLSEPYDTVKRWRQRDSIPARAHRDVIRAAHERGLHQITCELMDEIAARRADRGAA